MPRGGARAGSGQPQKNTQQKAVYLYPEQIAKLKAITESKKLTLKIVMLKS
jgi:hypothetical protein